MKRPSDFFCRLQIALIFLGGHAAFCQEVGNAIPITDPSVRAAIVAPLIGCHALSKGKVEHHVSKDGQYALYGDIFGAGVTFAFTEFDKGAGFCEWRANHWEVKQAWNIPVGWDNPATAEERLGSTDAAKEAFAVLSLDQGGRLVSIAGDVGKYHQEFYVAEYNVLKHAPTIVGVTMKPPYQRAGYWVLYTCSPRLAEWEEWNFFRGRAGQMTHVAKWHEFVSARNPDNQSCTAGVFDQQGQLLQEAEIHDAESGSDGPDYRISTSKTSASIRFVWHKENDVDPDQAEMEMAYLFGKLTTLPTDAFPHDDAERYSRKLSALSSVRVTGDAKLVRQLSMAIRSKSR